MEERGSNTEDSDAENSASMLLMQEQPKLTAELTADSIELCKTVLSESSYNWFEMLEFLETKYGCNSAALIQEKFFSSIRSQKSNSN